MRSASSERGRGGSQAAGVYLHFPFCSIRCGYCDFLTVAGRDELIEPYLEAVRWEILHGQPEAPDRVDTVYFGGGTPSRMEPETVRRLLDALRERFEIDRSPEITLEGNPESLDGRRLEGYLRGGVTRISIGVQSFDDEVLRRAGRAHGAREAEEAVRRARDSGFADVSLDLIVGLPGEDLDRWDDTVRRAAALGPDHVSVYFLETDKDAPLARAIREGRCARAAEEQEVKAYRATGEVLRQAGYRQYEISNYALPGHESRHNLKYWTDAPYVGFGLGAHAYWGGSRRANLSRLADYLKATRGGEDPVEWIEPFDPARRAIEALILGLRLAQGVDLAAVERHYGVNVRRGRSEAWERAAAAGLTVQEGDRVRLSERGFLCSNELFASLI
jgi:oxygen-independent coproporphyrinogen-3 oxidase